MKQRVVAKRENRVVTLTLNRPEQGNAVDDPTMDEIIEALSELSGEKDVSVLVLRGAGDDFCVGRRGKFTKGSRPTAVQLRDNLRKILTVNSLLSRLPAITLAAVQGRALGFGAGLATRADLTVAAASARFGFPEIKGALPPTVVLSYLRHWIPRKKALELVVKGNEIDAAEAERLGMINQVVPDSLLEEEVQTWISLLLKADPIALRNCKEFLVDMEQVAPSEAATYGIHLLATLLSSR